MITNVLRLLLHGAFVIALLALAAALSAAAMPRLVGYSALVVNGGSMGQSAPNGSLVFARWVEAIDVELGDVIIIQEETDGLPATPKMHRVILLDEEDGNILARTKGDANPTADPNLYILPERVLTPAQTVPHLGYLVGFAMTPLGWVLFVLLPGMALCLLSLRSIWRGDDRPAAASRNTYHSSQRSSRQPSGPRRTPAPLLLSLAGAARIALLAGLVVLAVGLADSDDNSLAGAAAGITSEVGAATAPLAAWDGAGWQFNLTDGGVPSRLDAPTSGVGGLDLGIGR